LADPVERRITGPVPLIGMVSPDKREVKENYDELGGGLYDLRYRDEQNRKYDAALLVTVPRGGGVLFDDGCGTGMLMSRLESPTVGLDLTPSLLRTARGTLRENHHLVLGDAEHLPIRAGVFDGVYSITLIQNTPDKLGTVTEMGRITRPRGRIIVTALRAVFKSDFLLGLLEQANLRNVSMIGDAGTNDWIAYAEK
jgi:ubiquinone/menaquinone biosynthesis C-methylase UbiE